MRNESETSTELGSDQSRYTFSTLNVVATTRLEALIASPGSTDLMANGDFAPTAFIRSFESRDIGPRHSQHSITVFIYTRPRPLDQHENHETNVPEVPILKQQSDRNRCRPMDHGCSYWICSSQQDTARDTTF